MNIPKCPALRETGQLLYIKLHNLNEIVKNMKAYFASVAVTIIWDFETMLNTFWFGLTLYWIPPVNFLGLDSVP